MPAKVSVMRGCGLWPSGSSLSTTSRPGSASSAAELGEERRGVAVGAEPEVHEVEPAELADAQLVGVGALVAAHREGGVGRADPVEQRLAGQAVVRVGVVEGHAALVAPVDVDLPPVDLGAGLGGQPLVAGPGRAAAGQRDGEAVVRDGRGTPR